MNFVTFKVRKFEFLALLVRAILNVLEASNIKIRKFENFRAKIWRFLSNLLNCSMQAVDFIVWYNSYGFS